MEAVTDSQLANAREAGADLPGRQRDHVDSEDAHATLASRLRELRKAGLLAAEQQMEATVRELDVHYGSKAPEAANDWRCDLLPHVFDESEWALITAAFRQRLRAFERFLHDVYGRRQILRNGRVPIHAVLGSAAYQGASLGLRLPQHSYLHICGMAVVRMAGGALAVKRHMFGRPSGIGYMMQNRRALARVMPRLFEGFTVSSLTAAPPTIGEVLRRSAPSSDPDVSVVVLSPGPESAAYGEHGFLARRMGVPLVEGGDLLVLDDRLYLKTVRGLKRVDVVYNRVSEAMLDPLVLRKGSHVGVPGLVHCIRRGTVSLLNGIGSELADDRAVLGFSDRIIRYYLNEQSLLPSFPTYWMGDIDQREMVLDRPDDFTIHPLIADELADQTFLKSDALERILNKNAAAYVAQPLVASNTARYVEGKLVEASAEHIIFAIRDGEGYTVLPGALTRVSEGRRTVAWKDSWVLTPTRREPELRRSPSWRAPARGQSPEVTSRVAEGFYWLGRYLERAYHQAYLIQVIETLETEEFNPAERKLYRPMWTRLLSPLDRKPGESRRRSPTQIDRYRLVLLPERGSVLSTLQRAIENAEALQESMSPEAWATLNSLYQLYTRTRFKEQITEEEGARVALRLTAKAIQRIPQFFAIAQRTMLGDDSWRFCETGENLERAIITASALCDLAKSLDRGAVSEIQLSAFLRLLASRDVYRRIFQVRAEPALIMEMLSQHPDAPRSILRCLRQCRGLLAGSRTTHSLGADAALAGMDHAITRTREIDWRSLLPWTSASPSVALAAKPPDGSRSGILKPTDELLSETLGIHGLISDGFLSHQAYITETVQPMLQGFRDGV